MRATLNSVAFWAAVATFFGSIVTFKAVGLLVEGTDPRLALSAFLTALVVAATVYSRTRLADAKKAERARPRAPRGPA